MIQRMSHARVSIVMGSDNDLETMLEAATALKSFNVPYEVRVFSAHRSPNLLAKWMAEAEAGGTKVYIAGAGAAAALPGAVAALTSRPVIGVPIPSSHLQGLDSLLAIAQLPPGTPAATVAIGKGGARNAGLLAVQILATGDEVLAAKYVAFKEDQEAAVGRKDEQVRKQHGA